MVKRDAKYPDSVDFKLLDTSVQNQKPMVMSLLRLNLPLRRIGFLGLSYLIPLSAYLRLMVKVEFEYIK